MHCSCSRPFLGTPMRRFSGGMHDSAPDLDRSRISVAMELVGLPSIATTGQPSMACTSCSSLVYTMAMFQLLETFKKKHVFRKKVVVQVQASPPGPGYQG